MPAPLYPSEELQKRLRELGFTGDLNIAELGEMLPNTIVTWIYNGLATLGKRMYVCEPWETKTYPSELTYGEISSENEADARAKMLIYLKENNLI